MPHTVSGMVDPHLDARAAAKYLGLLPEVFLKWVSRGFIPPPSPETGGWTKAALDEAIEHVQRHGIQNDNPSRRHSHFVKIPNAHHVWRKLQQGDGAGHWLFYFRPTGEPLPGLWGSPEMITSLLACERERAAAACATDGGTAPAVGPARHPKNQLKKLAQLSRSKPAGLPKLVTRKNAASDHQAQLVPKPNGIGESPPPPLHRHSRRRATVTQADIARIIRAAKQAGATEIQVRLNDSSTVIVRLQADNSVESEDIIL